MGGLILPGHSDDRGLHRPIQVKEAQTVLIIEVERDTSFTVKAIGGMSDWHLEQLKGAFFRWIAQYKAHRRENPSSHGETSLQTPP